MSIPACFYADSGALRFWGAVGQGLPGASGARAVLHGRCRTGLIGDDPLEAVRGQLLETEATVRRRVARGAIEPLMLREIALRADAGDADEAAPRPA